MSRRKEQSLSARIRNIKFSPKMKNKLSFIFLVVVLVFVILVGRITVINTRSGDKYERKILEQQDYSSRTIPFRRGDILDRNGTVLATSERVYNIILDAKVLLANEKKVDPTVTLLTEVFGFVGTDIRKKLEDYPESRYIVLRKSISYDEAQAWNSAVEDREDISGVWLEEDYKRTYPYNALACDAIGFTSNGNVGSWGIEKSYNDILNGENGREYGYLTGDYGLERTVYPATPGNTVVTTLDTNLQSIIEKHIIAFNESHKNEAREGLGSMNTGVIVLNANTAEILAMASYPNYDLNNPRDLSSYYTEAQLEAMSDSEQVEALQKLWRNFCVSDTYEPGSTIKPFTVAGALEDGSITGDESYYCSGVKYVGGEDIKCHNTSGHGTLSVSGAIAQSCNVALMDIAEEMGKEEFVKYQRVFGFGEYTGVDLPGEANTASLVMEAEDMYEADLAANSFGQGFNTTMIQIASAYCSLVNGGSYYQPHIVKEIRNSSGDVITTFEPTLLKKTVSRETSDMLKEYMQQTVESGTASTAQIAGYTYGAKTGTAECLPRGNNEYVISFAGFAPVDNPQFVIYVVIDRPNVAYQDDSTYVTLLSRQILEEILPYLGVEKDASTETPGE